MASGDNKQHVTVTGTASTVTLPAGAGRVEVLNRSGAGEIYVSTNGATPTVGGNFDVVPAAVGAAIEVPMEGGGVLVKLVASASTTASVTVVA